MRIRTRSSLAVFLAAIGLLICALHFAIQTGMRRLHQGAFGAFNQIAAGRVNAELIIDGSSRAVMHYNPDIFERETGLSAFNIGRIGARTNIHTGVLQFYLAHNRPPRVFIENADLNSLETDPEIFDVPEYTPYLYDANLYAALRKRSPRIWRARYLPLYGYISNDIEFDHYLGLKALLGRQPYEDYEKGYLIANRSWTKAFARLKADRKAFYYDPEQAGIDDFAELLGTARAHGIPVIVVLSPMYREHLAMTAGLDRVRAELSAESRKGGAEFWDYSAMEPVSPDTRYFIDSSHMNAAGATLFSEAVGRRLHSWLAERSAK